MKIFRATLLAVFLSLSFWGEVLGQGNHRLIVSPQGPYTTIEAALTEAQAGDVIEVHAGVYYTSLVVNKSVTLEGVGNPVIDGGGVETVVKLTAPQIVFRGFEVRHSGNEPDFDHSGIIISAPNITVENNHLSEVLFGIFIERADHAIVRHNDITSKAAYDMGRKGDGIRSWYSEQVVIEQNHLHAARDMVIWYSQNIIIRDNLIEDGRFGIHLMYSNQTHIEHNSLRNNSVGIYAMYSTDVTLRGNDLRGQRGPSGYALGFKDASGLQVNDNLLIDNRGGIFLDNTPFNPGSSALFQNNIVAFNDIGVIMLTAVHGNTFEGNTFWENAEQVSLQGNGLMAKNVWQKNYWSDYAGFDLNNDGLGDAPYRAEHFFENLTDRTPLLRALIYSPAAQTIEFAASSFPIFKPQPKFTDATPAMQPTLIPATAQQTPKRPMEMIALGLGFVTFSLLCGGLAWRRGGNLMKQNKAPQTNPTTISSNKVLVQLQAVTKRYGKATALSQVSLEVQAGEAIALWGENGAGKTTLIKAVLGLIDFQGTIQVNGYDTQRQGKAARENIGYVPQETIFYDMSVQATMEFYARLKKINQPSTRISQLLAQLGLAEHASKQVPTLSGGLKQRVALAVALLADPPVLVCDEPTANLDAKARRDYLALLLALRKEHKTIIFASHRLEEVETLADRLYIMEAGQVIETLTPNEARVKLTPHAELTLWINESERPQALQHLQAQGIAAHLNGRGTVVAHIGAAEKLATLQLLAEQKITVNDFEIERGKLWN